MDTIFHEEGGRGVLRGRKLREGRGRGLGEKRIKGFEIISQTSNRFLKVQGDKVIVLS